MGILLFFTGLKIALKIKDTAQPRPSCQINCSATKGSSATRLRPKLKKIILHKAKIVVIKN
jgi:hypothetical protein